MLTFHKLSVKEIQKETDDSVSIVFNIPDNLRPEFNFIPGQYINIKKELLGEDLRRAYSICSSLQSNVLRIGVKAVENGKFSVYATTELEPGDILEVSPPEGRFILNPKSGNEKNYLAFAAGSGITPILSMIKSVLEVDQTSKFILIYGNRSPEKTMFKKEIDSLQEDYSDQFFVHYAYSKTSEQNAFFGRIEDEICNNIVKNKYKELKFDEVFLCGPEPMTVELKNCLLSNGFRNEEIHIELFSTKDEEVTSMDDLSGDTTITIILDEEEETFKMQKSKTVLDVALKKGLDAPYSCQGGICSTCLAKVKEGKAVMEKNTILSDEEVKDGLILTCQAHPVTGNIVVDYDDV